MQHMWARFGFCRLSLRHAVLAAAAVMGFSSVAGAQGFSVLYQFTPLQSLYPGDLTQGTDRNFYGTSQGGGTAGLGTTFRMSPGGDVVVLHSFTGSPEGALPLGSLIQSRDGNFYGTTVSGGAEGAGTVFGMTPAGIVYLLHSFAGSDGNQPRSGVIEAADGNFYGTTLFGGAFDEGTIFRVSRTGAFTVLHSFGGGATDGAFPDAGGLTQAADGDFYGTTPNGGAADLGTVYKMTAAGTVTLLHSFAAGPLDGQVPEAALVQAIDGNFFGTTEAGGTAGLGTVFRISAAGSFVLMHSFTGGAAGSIPVSALTRSSDLSFYGATLFGGSANAGTIFRMTSLGAVTTVHAFTGADGHVAGRVIHARDGYFYGTTATGGSADVGVAFRFLNGTACDDTLALSYAAGTLSMGFTLKTSAAALWNVWAGTAATSAHLWSTALPTVPAPVSVAIPFTGVPNVGNVFVLTTLSSVTGQFCADVERVSTSPPPAVGLRVPGDFPTIQTAINAAAPGDLIVVDPGVYLENLQFNGKNVTLLSAKGPALTTIRGFGTPIDIGTIDIGPGATIAGFTITGGNASFGAGMAVHGVGTLVIGNVFDGNIETGGGFGAAIGGNVASPVIERNVFQNNSCDNQFLSGVVSFVNASSPRIVNNVFKNNPCRGINLVLPQEAQPLVINNTIVGNVSGVHVATSIPTDSQIYRNNLIVGNQIGLEVENGIDANKPTWQNNLVFGNGTDYSGVTPQTGLNGNISADPLFVNGNAGDYHLQSGSPAIGAGTTQGAPDTDFDGRPRGKSIDIGAFQFVPPAVQP